MHPKADTTSHRRAPTRGCADLPHWRSVIRSKDGQYRILPRGAAFEAISGAGHRILLATGAAAPPGLQETCSAIFSLAPLCPRKHTATHLFQRILRCLQRLRRSVAAQRRVVPARVLANACRAERVGAGAAGADMQRERCCTGAYFAQKWWCICFGGVWDVCRVRDAKQQLGSVASCPAAGKCCRWEQRGPGAAGTELQRERCCIGACAAQKQWRICFRRNFNV